MRVASLSQEFPSTESSPCAGLHNALQESTWNAENRFTGWTDVDLSAKGEEEAKEAGQMLKDGGYDFDIAYTSVLRRAIRTCWSVDSCPLSVHHRCLIRCPLPASLPAFAAGPSFWPVHCGWGCRACSGGNEADLRLLAGGCPSRGLGFTCI